MDTEQLPFPDPTNSDADLLVACRFIQESELSSPLLLTCWLALQSGWHAHVARIERALFAGAPGHDREPPSALRPRYYNIDSKLEQRALDLSLGKAGAVVAAKIQLDAVIERVGRHVLSRARSPSRADSELGTGRGPAGESIDRAGEFQSGRKTARALHRNRA